MVARSLAVYLTFMLAAQAEQWDPSLATTASLRTGGARLASSDALALDDGNVGLITYWEVRTDDDLDIYRCIDVVDSRFAPVSQSCWKVLRPTGRVSKRAGEARSSRDICPTPDNVGGSSTGYCSYSVPTRVRTPAFEITIESFGEPAAVTVADEGRSLVIIDPPWPSDVTLSVSAMDRADHVSFADASETLDILELHDNMLQCEPREVSSRMWAACRPQIPSDSTVLYRIQGDQLYEIWYSYPEDADPLITATVDRMIESFQTIAEAAP